MTTLVDVPLLFALSLRTVLKIGHCYGYPLEQDKDQHFVLGVLLTALSGSLTRSHRLNRLRELEELLIVETQEEILTEELWSFLFQLEIFEAVPGVGVISGALLNLAFMQRVDATAQWVFQERWLRDNGKVDAIAPALVAARHLAGGWSGVRAAWRTRVLLPGLRCGPAGLRGGDVVSADGQRGHGAAFETARPPRHGMRADTRRVTRPGPGDIVIDHRVAGRRDSRRAVGTLSPSEDVVQSAPGEQGEPVGLAARLEVSRECGRHSAIAPALPVLQVFEKGRAGQASQVGHGRRLDGSASREPERIEFEESPQDACRRFRDAQFEEGLGHLASERLDDL